MELREFPKEEKRVETGPVRFGDDWPGLFIRGDNAIIAGAHLEACCRHMESGHALPPMEMHKLRNLAGLLQECHAKNIWPAPEGEEEAPK